jgi:hypothetical protein
MSDDLHERPVNGTRDETVTDESDSQGLIFHEFQHSAVRNMVRGGTPEAVAVKISSTKRAASSVQHRVKRNFGKPRVGKSRP